MKQEYMNIKEFVAKEDGVFRLRIKVWKCLAPSNLNSVEFINESLNDKKEVIQTSTYSFFLTNNEIQTLCEGLMK